MNGSEPLVSAEEMDSSTSKTAPLVLMSTLLLFLILRCCPLLKPLLLLLMTKQLFCAVGDVAFRFPRRRFLVLILPFFNREDEDDEDANNGENDLNEDDVNGCITIALITQGAYLRPLQISAD